MDSATAGLVPAVVAGLYRRGKRLCYSALPTSSEDFLAGLKELVTPIAEGLATTT